MKIVHITFEKLTGLKGTIEGSFILRYPASDDRKKFKGVVVLRHSTKTKLRFSQDDISIGLAWLPHTTQAERENYLSHFREGSRVLLIKEWSYDSGRRSVSQNPN